LCDQGYQGWLDWHHRSQGVSGLVDNGGSGRITPQLRVAGSCHGAARMARNGCLAERVPAHYLQRRCTQDAAVRWRPSKDWRPRCLVGVTPMLALRARVRVEIIRQGKFGNTGRISVSSAHAPSSVAMVIGQVRAHGDVRVAWRDGAAEALAPSALREQLPTPARARLQLLSSVAGDRGYVLVFINADS
jgi:hypothetical protein